MEDKAQDKECFTQSNTVDRKDRRRFLKKMAVCAIVAPAITILPQRFAAASSGNYGNNGNNGNHNGNNGNHNGNYNGHN
jgi:hypothetical protein